MNQCTSFKENSEIQMNLIYMEKFWEIENCFEGDDVFVPPTMEKNIEGKSGCFNRLYRIFKICSYEGRKYKVWKFEGLEVKNILKQKRDRNSDIEVKEIEKLRRLKNQMKMILKICSVRRRKILFLR